MTTVDCQGGVLDCGFNSDGVCAPYNEEYPGPRDLRWLVPLAAIFMCFNAFGVGANDVANAWGTSVAAGAVSLRTACLIAGFANILGAVTLGYGVSDAIQKGVAPVTDSDCWACGRCNSKMTLYAVGMFAALMGSSVFLLLATFGSAPVSGTHAVVGGVVGMTLAAVGGGCLVWSIDGGLGGIILSWVLSPLVSGIIAAGLYLLTDKFIMRAENPKKRALTFFPFFIAGSGFIIMLVVLLKSRVTKHAMPIYGHFFTAVGFGAVMYFVGYYCRKRYVDGTLPGDEKNGFADAMSGSIAEGDNSVMEMGEIDDINKVEKDLVIVEKPDDSMVGKELDIVKKKSSDAVIEKEVHMDEKDDKDFDKIDLGSNRDAGIHGDDAKELENASPEVRDAIYTFKYLLVFNACLESFAHGSNDTGNSTAPFSAIWNTYNAGLRNCKKPDTPAWVLFVAGCCVAMGVNTFGYRVMATVGKKITVVNFHRGFCMEFASTAAVVLATLFRMPVSTTHCQIGAVVAVGIVSFGWRKVKFGVVGQIVLSWIITLPFAGAFAAMMVAIMRAGVKN
ncbi:hypothetical protein AAMO2058_000470000 [Amorphochlora amoebiformis]|uniref:Phosphate transporter n=1 Tax=Amorphochlora amoebiformis TaxID=1561963 RepID=A0A7S0DR57_9EUKA|mmetsp:Transcript_661/g.937  ORF Transcript_661/g.937 Transcript_661/m.937 type:complete len:561 (+) Transcript_661:42-1724(+)